MSNSFFGHLIKTATKRTGEHKYNYLENNQLIFEPADYPQITVFRIFYDENEFTEMELDQPRPKYMSKQCDNVVTTEMIKMLADKWRRSDKAIILGHPSTEETHILCLYLPHKKK